jgi:AmmeMemoRadiSam system protein A
MDAKDKSFLLSIARKAIKAHLDGEDFNPSNIPPEFCRSGCCFVTLSIDGELRGCIGNLEAFEPLYKNIINNAINAAFKDNRFNPLSYSEFKKVKIEISVLSPPEKLFYLNSDDLLSQLSKDVGVILKKGFHQSTFLPQVWDVIPDKVDFLENLSQKAGLAPIAWMDNSEIFIYKVTKFSE